MPATVGAALASGGLGLIGGYLSNQTSARSARRSINAQIQAQKNRYTWAVEDAKRAGLNPYVAAGSPAGGIGGASFTARNIGQDAVDAFTKTKATDSQADLNTSQEELNQTRSRVEQALLDPKVKQILSQSELNKALTFLNSEEFQTKLAVMRQAPENMIATFAYESLLKGRDPKALSVNDIQILVKQVGTIYGAYQGGALGSVPAHAFDASTHSAAEFIKSWLKSTPGKEIPGKFVKSLADYLRRMDKRAGEVFDAFTPEKLRSR